MLDFQLLLVLMFMKNGSKIKFMSYVQQLPLVSFRNISIQECPEIKEGGDRRFFRIFFKNMCQISTKKNKSSEN